MPPGSYDVRLPPGGDAVVISEVSDEFIRAHLPFVIKKFLLKGAEIAVHVFRATGPVGDILAETLLAPVPLNTIEAEQEARLNAEARDRATARAGNMPQGLAYDAGRTDP